MSAANKLFTKTAFAKVPALGTQEGKGDNAIARVKLFAPMNGWRWYITEYDPITKLAFGLVAGVVAELGHFDIQEMQEVNDNWRGRFRMPPVERILHGYSPKTIGEIKASIERGNPA